MDCLEAKKLVLRAGAELVKSGLIVRTWGNASCRISENAFAITPTGKEYLSLSSDDIVEVNISDLSYKGTIKPSSEKRMHGAIYKLFPEINFIIHTHQENASVVSAIGLDLINLPTNYPFIGSQISCAEYAPPGTKALSNKAIEAFNSSKGNAILLKNHGAICIGKNYEEAFKATYGLERACDDFIKMQSQNPPTSCKPKVKSFPQYPDLLLNDDPEVIRFSQLNIEMKPFLDDFAQIVGTKVKTVKNDSNKISKALEKSSAVFVEGSGALCTGKNKSEASDVSIILKKNCKAYFFASLFGKPKPINWLDCFFMHRTYVTKYSKLAD